IAGCSASSARSAASGTATGSMDCMAASGALLPLASGTIDAICDFKLDGTLAGAGCVPWADIGATGAGALAIGPLVARLLGTAVGCGSGCPGSVPEAVAL